MAAGSAASTTRSATPRPASPGEDDTACSSSAAADIGHLGRHHGHELDVRLERQRGHVDDAVGDVADIHTRLGFDPAGRLQPAARCVLVAGCCGVADVDLAASNIVLASVE